jgi:hypothetical protein
MMHTPPSQLVQFSVAYSPDTVSTAPSNFFLKIPRPAMLETAQREAHFYNTIAPLLPKNLLLPWYCVDVTIAQTPALLLGDVSTTHMVWHDQISSLPVLESMSATLAQLHAWAWERTDIEEYIGESSQMTLASMFVQAQARYQELVDSLGDTLNTEQRLILEAYIRHAPKLFQTRLQQKNGLTLCHPDNHPENFLLPRFDQHEVYLIDWQVYRWWWGGVDLAALLTRSVCSALQPQRYALLRRYHTALQMAGVTNYPWEACWYDYQLGVIDTVRVVLSMRQRPQSALRVLLGLVQEWHSCRCWELCS